MTNEMMTIMLNFKARKRIHKDKLLNITRLYTRLSHSGNRLRRKEFDQAFLDLEAKGYGLIDRTKSGQLTNFLPALPLNVIGREMLSTVKNLPNPVQTPRQEATVTVIFSIAGKRCKAIIPESVLPEFERKVGT